MNNSIVCLNYSEITQLIPFITNCYNNGNYVHFLNILHQELNCSLLENTVTIFIPVELRQAARIIINEYNNHFCVNEDDEDDDDEDDDNDEDDGDENTMDPTIAFTCPACCVLPL